MPPSIAFCLLSICMQLKLHVCDRICLKNQYTILWSNGSVKNCLYCEKCHPGLGLSPVCGSSIMYPPKNIDCNPCPSGTFSDKDDSAPCQNCQECVALEIVASNCTRSSDRNCTGTCIKGYYFAKKAPHNCQQCSYCCNDGKDEMQLECIDQGLNATNQHCSRRLDKKCGPEPTSITTPTPQPTNTGQIVGIVLGVVALITALVCAVCCKKKKVCTASVAPEASPGEAPCPTDDEPADVVVSHKILLVKPQTSKDAPSDSTSEKLLHNVDPKVQCHNENVAEQQDIKGAESGNRRRSSSGTLQTLKRKLSIHKDDPNYQPLSQEDSDEVQEPIKIIEHPKSQTAKEGSKVELKCKVQGKCSRLLYQWFKDDGSAVVGQNEDSLVLESVKLRDFGRYTCKVTYNDNFDEGKTSSPAKLDVTPQNQNGMRPKLLQELDINTRDEVASLLENKIFSLGGYKQVAARYGMMDHKREALNNSNEPGQDVLEFLKGSKPNLTVYDFCKVLKEDKIKRLDIVKKLEDHFLI